MPGGGDRGGRLKDSQGKKLYQSIRAELNDAYECSGDPDKNMQHSKILCFLTSYAED